MEYRKFDGTIYARLDRGDEMIGVITDICRREKLESAVFSGIGACSSVEIQTFDPDRREFETMTVSGMLELVSLSGNVITDEDMNYYSHVHAILSYKEDGEHRMIAGHMKSMTTLYTGEIEIRPVTGGAIKKQFNEETGTAMWKF